MDQKTEAVVRLVQAAKHARKYLGNVYDLVGDYLDDSLDIVDVRRELEDALTAYEASRMDSTVDRLHEALNAPSGKCGHCHKASATHFCQECEEPCCPTCHCQTREVTNEQP